MAAYANTEFWTEFILLYKSFPETWDFEHEDYKNKRVKNRAYEKMLQKLRVIEPKATLTSVKKRLINLRACYRRELKKVNESIRSGAKEIHKPCLWYYDLLSFVKNQAPQNKGEALIELDSDEDYNFDTDEDTKPSLPELRKQMAEEIILSSPQPKRPRIAEVIPNTSAAPKDPITRTQRTELLLKAINHLDNVSTTPNSNLKDEADIFAAGWATLFRKLSPDQQLFANKTIGEVLYQGALGNLKEYTYKAIDQ